MRGRVHLAFGSSRRPIRRQRRPESVPLAYWHLLFDEPRPPDVNPFSAMSARRALPVLWAAHREEILGLWILRHPGTRPSCWWAYDAPRLGKARQRALAGFWGSLERYCEPRRVVGGDGEPAECWAPTDWGILNEWVRVNPDDPPLIESQAAYLKRHGLLLRGEAKRLKARDFKPERLPRRWWPRFDELERT